MTKEEFKKMVVETAKISKNKKFGDAVYDVINEAYGIGMDVEFETLIFPHEIEYNLNKYLDSAYDIIEKKDLFNKDKKNEEDF